jgi:hypothetical protein
MRQWLRLSLSRRTTALACALFIVIPPAVAYATTDFNYVDNQLFSAYQSGWTSGLNPRVYNKVWRSVGNQFAMTYELSDTETTTWFNTWSNPYTTPSSGGLSVYAGCQNYTPNVVTPVTCRTTRP